MGVYIPQDANTVCRMIPPSVLNELGAVIIPTPHGRLIDADKLSNWHKYTAKGRRELQAAFALAVVLNDAPTVIDAEDKT